jgi:hypothetical protein
MKGLPNFEEFVATLSDDAPPEVVPKELAAMWWAKRDQWTRAHDLVQDLTTAASSRVHAHLHRIEGDLDNANYWYRRAGVMATDVPVAAEWDLLTKDLLDQASADSGLR